MVNTGPQMASYNQPLAIAQKGAANIIAGVFGDVMGGEEVAQANASFICLAVNNHEGLVAACISMRARLDSVPINYTVPGLCVGDLKRWDDALNTAQGGAK